MKVDFDEKNFLMKVGGFDELVLHPFGGQRPVWAKPLQASLLNFLRPPL